MIVQPLSGDLVFILQMTWYPGTLVDALYGHIVVLRVYKFINNRFQLLCIDLKGTKAYVHFVRLKSQMGIQYQRCGQVIILREFTRRHTRRLRQPANCAAVATVEAPHHDTHNTSRTATATSASSCTAMR